MLKVSEAYFEFMSYIGSIPVCHHGCLSLTVMFEHSYDIALYMMTVIAYCV